MVNSPKNTRSFPIIVTVEDAKNPTLLFRLLSIIATKIMELGNKVDAIVSTFRLPNITEIRQALQSTGSAPINVTGLRGVLADPQPASAIRYPSIPAAQELQALKDTQLITVKNGTAYDLYTVIGGNPNSLFKLIGGAAGGTMMTIDTAQTVTGVKTFQVAPIYDNNIVAIQQKDSTIVGVLRSSFWLDNANPDVLHVRNDQRNNGGTIAFESQVGGVRSGFFDASGFFVKDGINGSILRFTNYGEEMTLSTVGATTDSTAFLLPASSLILSVTFRVTQAISGGGVTTIKLGDSVQADRFFSGTNITLGDGGMGLDQWKGSVATDAKGPFQNGTAKVRITMDGTPTQGKVRVSLFAMEPFNPTS